MKQALALYAGQHIPLAKCGMQTEAPFQSLVLVEHHGLIVLQGRTDRNSGEP